MVFFMAWRFVDPAHGKDAATLGPR